MTYPTWLIDACKRVIAEHEAALRELPTAPPVSAKAPWKMSDFALANLMHFENDPLRTGELQYDRARFDSIGNVSDEIGYGMTPDGRLDCIRYGVIDSPWQLPSRVTRKEAYDMLINIIVPAHALMVDKVVTVTLNNNQKDALILFAYNLGEKSLKTMVSGPGRLNSGGYTATPAAIKLYNKGDGVVQPGLVRRRNFEAALFMSDLTTAQTYTRVSGFDKQVGTTNTTPF